MIASDVSIRISDGDWIISNDTCKQFLVVAIGDKARTTLRNEPDEDSLARLLGYAIAATIDRGCEYGFNESELINSACKYAGQLFKSKQYHIDDIELMRPVEVE